MNEEDLIKQEFIRENIERDFRAIFEAQRLIALERIYSRASYSQTGQNLSQRRSGELLKALQIHVIVWSFPALVLLQLLIFRFTFASWI